MRIKQPLPSNWRVFRHLFMGEVSDWVSSSPGKNGANLVSKLAACLKRSSNGDRLSAVWKALFIPGFLNFLKCPGLALFSYWCSLCSPHVLYVGLCICIALSVLILPFRMPRLVDYALCLHSIGQTTFQSIVLASIRTKPNLGILVNLEILTRTCLGKKDI